jgi:hypothetical protein
MQAFRIAVFLAIIGALVGAVDSTMAAAEHPWWPGTGNTTIDPNATSNITSEQVDGMDVSEDSSTAIGSTIQELTIIGVGTSMLKGIFSMGGVIDSMLFGGADSDVRTAFQPFLYILTVGVDCIYMMALLQIWRKTPLAGAY